MRPTPCRWVKASSSELNTTAVSVRLVQMTKKDYKMAEFLEQDEINKLQEEMLRQLELSATAKDKIALIYEDVLGIEISSPLSTLKQISDTVRIIGSSIGEDHVYYPDFRRLELALRARLR